MTGLGLLLCLGAAAPADPPVTQAVEQRYNRLRTLQVDFEERVSYGERVRRAEKGTLYLLRPGKMRWEYTDPKGKLFVADGQMFYLYSPHSNQVQRLKPKAAADWRAPLAFLLGRLDFGREFGPITIRPREELIELAAAPRSEREPFKEAVFHVAARTFEIRRIVVTGQDGMVTEFLFRGERANPALEAGLFRFEPPAGAEIVDAR
jgi:outer membrane lipoprotein carrier protein